MRCAVVGCPHSSHIYSPPRASRFAAFYSVSATYSCSSVRRPQLSYGYLSLAQLGNLPLHYAVMNQASETVVRALFETHPDGAKETGEVTM